MSFKKMLALLMSVLSIAACALPFSGCGKTVGKVHNKGVKSGAVRNLTENISKNDSGSKAADKEFKAAAASFSADLFKYNYSNGKTTLVSPLSVLTALALVQNGAEGETLAQLERALGGLDRDALNKYMRAYCDFLSAGDELKIANSVWTDSSVEAKQAFLQKAVDSYSAQIFSAPLSSKKTVSSINSWVKKNTDGMIPKIIENADRDAVMMLINAIAFDAKWETPYKRSDIEKLEFTSYSGSKKKTEFMCSTESVYLSDSDKQERLQKIRLTMKDYIQNKIFIDFININYAVLIRKETETRSARKITQCWVDAREKTFEQPLLLPQFQ